jgi:hypothetical protein
MTTIRRGEAAPSSWVIFSVRTTFDVCAVEILNSGSAEGDRSHCWLAPFHCQVGRGDRREGDPADLRIAPRAGAGTYFSINVPSIGDAIG